MLRKPPDNPAAFFSINSAFVRQADFTHDTLRCRRVEISVRPNHRRMDANGISNNALSFGPWPRQSVCLLLLTQSRPPRDCCQCRAFLAQCGDDICLMP